MKNEIDVEVWVRQRWSRLFHAHKIKWLMRSLGLVIISSSETRCLPVGMAKMTAHARIFFANEKINTSWVCVSVGRAVCTQMNKTMWCAKCFSRTERPKIKLWHFLNYCTHKMLIIRIAIVWCDEIDELMNWKKEKKTEMGSQFEIEQKRALNLI